MKVIEVKNLSKKYKNLEVIKDISFSIEEGETLVILGASGSGKSTILRCINNLEKIDKGNIIINGRSMIKEEKKGKIIYNDKEILNKINLDIGMVFQDFNLFPHLSVKENIMLAPIEVLKKNREEAEKIAIELLKKMDLLDKKDEYPCSLSGGQKQRVSIARCLAIDPKIICMDEPTSSLDPELVGEVLKVIKKLAKEKRTMIIVTHEIKFAEEVADRIIFMDSGKIVEEGSPKDVIKNPREKRTQEFLKRYIKLEAEIINKKRYIKRKNKSKKEDMMEDNEDVTKKKIKNEKINEVDLKEQKELNNIEPKEVIKFFREISYIPRKSGNEEKIKDYLVDFAKKRNFEYFVDEYFNVIIKRKSEENKKTIAFQAHTDMICEKRDDIEHDFSKDPIKLIVDGDYLRADGTTLGADNGIGVAQILALLDSDKFKNINIEGIFTVQEETTMIGAKEIDLSKLESNKIISLDGGREGKILVGSANCLEWSTRIKKEYEYNLGDYTGFKLIYKNFKGGHSGGNIDDEKRGNPIKLGIDILKQAEDVYIKEISGGSRVNVIPRDFCVEFFMKKEKLNKVKEFIKKQKELYENVIIEIAEKNEINKKAFTRDITNRIIDFIYNYENGVLEKVNKAVILSCNMATVKEDEDYINIEYSTRANDLNLRDIYLKRLNKLIEKNNLEIIWRQELKGVSQKIDNELINLCNRAYKNLYGKDLEKMIRQAVVEGGFFKDKIKDLEYVCLGPDTEDVHSPNERLSISSLKRTWKVLEEILKIY